MGVGGSGGRFLALGVLVLVLVLQMVGSSMGWCPVSHYTFVCEGSGLQKGAEPCICQGGIDPNLFIGSELPDAFAGGAFFSEDLCPTSAPALHDGIFAGHMLQLAISQNQSASILALAQGFASHAVADYAGFLPTGLLYTPLPTDWLTMFPFMLTVDAYLLQNFSATCTPNLTVGALSEEGASFIANATAYYNTINSQFPVLNTTQVLSCTDRWARQVSEFNSQALNQLPITTQNQLQYFDPNEPASFEEAAADFEMARSCAKQVVNEYLQLLLSKKLAPEDAYPNAIDFLQSLFDAGQCSPQPPSSSSTSA